MTVRPLITITLILLAAGAGACQPNSGPAAEHRESAPQKAEMPFTESTVHRLRAERHPAILAVRCDRVEIHDPGSRSETLIVTATLLAAGVPDKPEDPVILRRYADSAPKMEAGKAYLVAAVGEFEGWWTPLEAIEIEESRAAELARAAADAL